MENQRESFLHPFTKDDLRWAIAASKRWEKEELTYASRTIDVGGANAMMAISMECKHPGYGLRHLKKYRFGPYNRFNYWLCARMIAAECQRRAKT